MKEIKEKIRKLIQERYNEAPYEDIYKIAIGLEEAFEHRLMQVRAVYENHRNCRYNICELKASKKIVCFYCMNAVKFEDIKEWVDRRKTVKVGCDVLSVEATGLCPQCGADTLIGDFNSVLDDVVINEMNEYWFGDEFDDKTGKWVFPTNKKHKSVKDTIKQEVMR
jgi:hypothetical protein